VNDDAAIGKGNKGFLLMFGMVLALSLLLDLFSLGSDPYHHPFRILQVCVFFFI